MDFDRRSKKNFFQVVFIGGLIGMSIGCSSVPRKGNIIPAWQPHGIEHLVRLETQARGQMSHGNLFCRRPSQPPYLIEKGFIKEASAASDSDG